MHICTQIKPKGLLGVVLGPNVSQFPDKIQICQFYSIREMIMSNHTQPKGSLTQYVIW